MKMKKIKILGVLLMFLAVSVLCFQKTEAEEGDSSGEGTNVTVTENNEEPTPSEEPAPTEEPTVTEEPTPTPTPEPTATPTPEPTPEPSPSPTEEPDPTPEPTPTPDENGTGAVAEEPTLTPSPEPSKRDRIYVDFLMEKDDIENNEKTVFGKIRKWMNIREEDIEKLPRWLRTGYPVFLVVGVCLIPLSLVFGIILAKSHKENRKWVKRGYIGFCIVIPAVITALLLGIPALCLFLSKAF